jgi:hypothetical protein
MFGIATPLRVSCLVDPEWARPDSEMCGIATAYLLSYRSLKEIPIMLIPEATPLALDANSHEV